MAGTKGSLIPQTNQRYHHFTKQRIGIEGIIAGTLTAVEACQGAGCPIIHFENTRCVRVIKIVEGAHHILIITNVHRIAHDLTGDIYPAGIICTLRIWPIIG